MNKNLPTNEDDEAEVNEILRETFVGCDYYDEQIGHLLKGKQYDINQFLLAKDNKKHSHESKQSSEASDYSPVYRQQFKYVSDDEQKWSFENSQKEEQEIVNEFENDPQKQQQVQQFSQINNQIRQFTKEYSIQKVKEEYPNFLISQPSYTTSKTYTETISKYSASLLNINIQSVQIGYCKSQQNYIIVIGSDDGRVAIFQEKSTKPITFYQVFESNRKILSIKWSQNQRYLIVTSDFKQLKVYDFKQPVQIQQRTILRMRNKPIELFFLTNKEISHSIICITQISQSPFKFLALDEQSQIYLLQWKKHIFNFRPYLTKALPVKFVNVFQIKTITTFINNIQVCLLAVGSQSYVTLAVIKPQFQIILVYDKEKHGKNINKQGYPSIQFRNKPLGLLIVWGKYSQIININIQTSSVQEKLVYRISGGGYLLFPQNSIICGFLTNTLIYQLSHSGIKIYATHHYKESSINNMDMNIKEYESPPQPIYQFTIKYFQLPSGLLIQEQITNAIINISILRMLQNLIIPRHKQLFIVFNTSLLIIKIQDFEQCIFNTIENLNNWKVGLQLLYDSYRGYIKTYDRITKDVIIKNVKEYSIRYIGFLRGVINFKEQRQLWDQEIIFIFNLLIDTHQYEFLLTKILNKLMDQGFCLLINNIQPFIYLNKLPIINANGLQLMLKYFQSDSHLIGRLLMNLSVQDNEVDLPHQINQLLLNHHKYTQLIIVNNLFHDFYTPFAVLASQYQLCRESREQELPQLAQYITYSIHRTITIFNNNHHHQEISLSYSKKQKILQNILPLFQSTLIPILLKHKEKVFYSTILPQLYDNVCLQLLNSISNKRTHMNNDIMTNIVANIPHQYIQHTKEYWVCVIQLYNKRVLKMNIYMGIKYLVQNSIDEEFVQNIIQYSQREVTRQLQELSIQIVEEFFKVLQNTNYTSLIRVVGTIIKEHIKVIHTLIGSNHYRNNRLYQYIQEHIYTMKEKEKDKLKYILLYNIEMFINIDVGKVTNIIHTFYSNDIESFMSLQINQQCSLVLTKSIINTIHSKNQQLITKLRLKYLRLLAITGRQDQILIQLKQEQYPLDESLQICEYYKVLDAQAYLLVKSGGQGDILTAIKLYFKLLLQKSSQLNLQNIEQYKQQFNHILLLCIQICKNNHNESVQEWFLLVEEVKEFKSILQTTISPYLYDLLSQSIDRQAYPILMKEIVLNAGLTSVSQYVDNSLSQLQLIALTTLIKEVQKNYTYEKVMLRLCQQSYFQDEQEKRLSIIDQVREGFRSNTQCDVCKIRDVNILMRYSCGHQVHPQCGRDVKSCVLCSSKQENIFLKSLDYLNRIKTEVYADVGEEKCVDKSNRKSLLSRMKEYDECFEQDIFY